MSGAEFVAHCRRSKVGQAELAKAAGLYRESCIDIWQGRLELAETEYDRLARIVDRLSKPQAREGVMA